MLVGLCPTDIARTDICIRNTKYSYIKKLYLDKFGQKTYHEIGKTQ